MEIFKTFKPARKRLATRTYQFVGFVVIDGNKITIEEGSNPEIDPWFLIRICQTESGQTWYSGMIYIAYNGTEWLPIIDPYYGEIGIDNGDRKKIDELIRHRFGSKY